MYSRISVPISGSQRPLHLHTKASLFPKTFIPTLNVEKKKKSSMNGSPRAPKVEWTDTGSEEFIFINVIASAPVKVSDWDTKNMLSTFYQKISSLDHLFPLNSTVHHMSSQSIFCVTDLGNQVDNLSSNYLHPRQPVTAQHGGLSPRSVRKDVLWADGKQLK